MTEKLKKTFTAEQKNTFFLDQKLPYNLPIPRPPKRISKLPVQKKPSALKREHQALQSMKFLNS
jgi:hypothetical protein